MNFFQKINPFRKRDENSKGKNDGKGSGERFEMYHSILGDKAETTRKGFSTFAFLMFLFIGAILTVVWLFVAQLNYNQFKRDNTTDIGTELKFTKSGAKVSIGDVWTDKSRDVVMVKLKYDNAARKLLSTNGKKYKLYLIDEKRRKPKDLSMSYGVLGTEGDGYLFLKGNIKEQAYHILITNQVEFLTGGSDSDSSGSEDDGLGETSSISDQDADDLTDSAIRESLSDVNQGDVSDNGIIQFNKKDKPRLDYIDFRVNAYSDTTNVYDGSFIDDKGDIDYGKVIEQTSLKQAIKTINDDIKKREDAEKRYNASIHEYKTRLEENEDDTKAKTNLEDAKDSKEQNEEELKNLRKLKKRYEEADFNKESFGEMQEEYKAETLH